MILAIDTSTSVSSLALYDGDVHVEQTWIADRSHTTQLLPQVDKLLGLAGLEPKDLKGLVVALGPGSFNGIRVGLSTAKGLAYALRIPLVGIGTLETIAYAYANLRMPIRPILDAGRGEISTALFETIDRKWLQREEPWIGGVPDIVSLTDRPTLLCGDIRKECVLELRRRLGELIHVPSGAANLRRAGYLAELGLRRLRAGDVDDVVQLQPMYLRGPAITKSRRADALAVRRGSESSPSESPEP
ncbi:MAG: tRNA (adenosine(37)-N6)-threonylcarbamoyltransferase complex dimerization subunit type 1 TsaB [Chloroflexi bacterium]|nr:tRNA (adenosine(37)-N6)-threonylcarbamoyltransferase complex dimerization subunit type 1 TsaB [Chloroflexota bacterium]